MKPSVLIVDDEKVICNGLSKLFVADYKMFSAFNGTEAIDIVKENSDIKVMICDIKMPGMEGVELIDRVRTENKDIYIIVITAAASPLKVCDAMKKGANYYMRKPLNISQLETTIDNAIKLNKVRSITAN